MERSKHGDDILADVIKGAMERGIDVPRVIAEVLRKSEPKPTAAPTGEAKP